jgi:hypothetical protein
MLERTSSINISFTNTDNLVLVDTKNETTEIKSSKIGSNENICTLLCTALFSLTLLPLLIQSSIFSKSTFADKIFTVTEMILIFTGVFYAVSKKKEISKQQHYCVL